MPPEIWNYHNGCYIQYVEITRNHRDDAALICSAVAAHQASGLPWESVGVIAHELDTIFLASWVADQAIACASKYAFEERFAEAEALLRTGWSPATP